MSQTCLKEESEPIVNQLHVVDEPLNEEPSLNVQNKQVMVEEKRYRSIVKAISWRVTGTIDTFIVSYIITVKPVFALSISGVEVVTKMFLYYWHERLWTRIKFGKVIKEPEYNI
jgi:uncharacterized membrane protein